GGGGGGGCGAGCRGRGGRGGAGGGGGGGGGGCWLSSPPFPPFPACASPPPRPAPAAITKFSPGTVVGLLEVMMDAWWSEATKLEFKWQNGGAYTGGALPGGIHTPESTRYTPPAQEYYTNYEPPPFTMV